MDDRQNWQSVSLVSNEECLSKGEAIFKDGAISLCSQSSQSTQEKGVKDIK